MADAGGSLPPGYRSSPASPFGELAPEDEPAARRATGSSLPVDPARTPGASAPAGRGASAAASGPEPVPEAAALAERGMDADRRRAPEPGLDADSGASASDAPAEAAEAAGPVASAESVATADPAAGSAHSAGSADDSAAGAPKRQVRGRRLPRLVPDGDGYTLPALAGRYRLDDGLFHEAVPGEPVLTFPTSAAPSRDDERSSSRAGLRASALVGIALILALASAPTAITRPFGLLFALPPLIAAIVVATIGLLRPRRAAAVGALALALIALVLDLLLIVEAVA